jgi:5-methylcytosine-specific restriction endonuclease McrA
MLDKKQYSLILTKDFTALDIVGVKKTMKYLCTDVGKAMDPVTYQLYNFDEWVELHNIEAVDSTVRTEKLWIKIPEIVVLNRNYVRRKSKGPKNLSKKKVFERDNNKCGYCGCSLNSKNRTIDHIIPVSKGGPRYDYSNVVACCSDCNGRKSDSSLKELGWKLLHDVGDPTTESSLISQVPKSKRLVSWEPYLN